MDPNFAFVLTPLDIQCAIPFEVISGHFFERATEGQIFEIKRFLNTLGVLAFESHYEFEWHPSKNQGDGANTVQGTRVSPEKWRYNVINYEGPNLLSGRLATALQLIEPVIELGFDAIRTEFTSGYSVVSRRGAVFSFFEDIAFRVNHTLVVVTPSVWAQARSMFQLLESLEQENPEVWRAVQNFEHAKMLPRDSTMSALALFAVMESLITHDPRVTFDSLNHQVASKMTLLSKRFDPPLTYEFFDSSTTPEKLWKKIYAYRSAIAHGGSLDFAKELQILKSHQIVLQFVRIAVRRLVAFAVRDPDFVADLRKC